MGVFGMVVFDSLTRRKEISIRKVVGSSVENILKLFNRTYTKILGISFILSCPLAYYIMSEWLTNFSLQTPLYWWVFILVGLAISSITLLLVTWQSWNAAVANPINSLRNE